MNILFCIPVLSRENSRQSNIDDPYSPIEVITTLKQHGFAMEPVEQDAHELFYLILITLEEEAHTTVAPSVSKLKKLFFIVYQRDPALFVW